MITFVTEIVSGTFALPNLSGLGQLMCLAALAYLRGIPSQEDDSLRYVRMCERTNGIHIAESGIPLSLW
jgi:hypothetical protein